MNLPPEAAKGKSVKEAWTAHWTSGEFGELAVVVTSWSPVFWGTDFLPGRYRVEWVSGVIGYNATWWTLSTGDNVQVLLAEGLPLSGVASSVRLLWPGLPRYTTQAAAFVGVETARATQFLEWEHAGGPIGMAVFDPNYTDNSGEARFRLRRV